MLNQVMVRAFLVGISLVALSACSSGDDDDDNGSCTAPSIKGTALGFEGGMGSVHGSGQLPDGIPNGKELLVIVDDGNSSGNIVPPGLTPTPLTCGKAFSFQASELPPGTYHIGYEVDDADFNSIAQGTSTNSFMITGSENVDFTPTFP